MISSSVMKMRELELESEADNTQCSSDEDDDTCDPDEISRTFEDCRNLAEETIAQNKYILQIAATGESSPNVAVNVSDVCEVYNLSNNQFAKLSVLSEHTDVISEIKFLNENSNLLYTGSNDGSIKLWDLRTPKKSTIQFKDTTMESDNLKQITCFDISANNLLLAAGTNLFEGDSFILFWDLRKHSMLGGYWESHTDDITQVKFHSDDPNKLLSGSVDGLINLYDLSQTNEDDALIDTLNTESSVEKLTWLQQENKDIISCLTHTADVQFWQMDDAQPSFCLPRADIAKNIRRKSEEHTYVVAVHQTLNSTLVLAGSNSHDGECFRGLSIVGKKITPSLRFSTNKQRVRASWYNVHTNILLTGGEKGIINAWEANPRSVSPQKRK